MNTNIAKEFGIVKSFSLGYGPLGAPMMNVYLYWVKGVLIDSAQSNMRRTVNARLKDLPIDAILLTHHHEDHSGNAAFLKQQRSVEVLGHERTGQKMSKPSKILPYQRYCWGRAERMDVAPIGDSLSINGLEFTAIHTPGHSPDHTVYLEKQNGILFSGDLYLGDRIKFYRADEDIVGQIESIRKVLEHDFDIMLCAHRPRLSDAKQHLQKKLEFLEEFFTGIERSWRPGMKESTLMKELKLQEQYYVKLICLGNVSMKNMVASAIRACEKGFSI